MAEEPELPGNEIRTQLNEIFKQVVVGRDWKSHTTEVMDLFERDEPEVIASLESIVLKIMVIPPAQ